MSAASNATVLNSAIINPPPANNNNRLSSPKGPTFSRRPPPSRSDATWKPGTSVLAVRSQRRTEMDDGFREYVAVRLEPLRRTAYLMCGDWHLADDVVSTALLK